MKHSFQLKEKFPVKPEVIYKAWLDSKEHADMTGGEATCSKETGGKFTAWDGYITGENVELIANKKIIQKWRTTEFDVEDEDSEITIELNEIEVGCEFILTHTAIPAGQPDYKAGWIENYITPMKDYFGSK